MKKSFDLLLSIFGLLVFSPLLLVLSIFIVIIDGFPIFFIQTRLGKNKVPFNIIKFRTMKLGESISSKDDQKRQTALGKVLRRTSLDELPVLINVIKGNMSLVGPRPLLIKYKDRFSSFQDRRHEVLPGITGLAQIKGRNQISWEDKFNYDIEYIDQRTFMLDIIILVKTIGLVLLFKGTSPNSQDIMPEFMGLKENENN